MEVLGTKAGELEVGERKDTQSVCFNCFGIKGGKSGYLYHVDDELDYSP